MTGTKRIRASWCATLKRKRAERRRLSDLSTARDHGFGEGRKNGIAERDKRYTRLCGTDPENRVFNLCDPPRHDCVVVSLGFEPFDLMRPDAPLHLRLRSDARATFVPVRKVWADETGARVQWWDWEFKGVSG